MREIGNYFVVTSSTYDRDGWNYVEFEKEVNSFMEEHPDYQPCGSITATKENAGRGMCYTLAQPFIKRI